MSPAPIAARSLRTRLTLAFAALLALVLLLANLAFVEYSRHTASRRADVALARSLESAREVLNGDDDEIREALRVVPSGRSASLPALAALWIAAQDDRGDPADQAEAVLVSETGQVWHSGRTLADWPPAPGRRRPGWRLREARFAGRDSAGRPTTYTVVAGVSWARVAAALSVETALLASLSLLAVAAAAGGAWMLVGRTLRPIDALTRQTERGAAALLTGPADRLHLTAPSRDAELVRLVDTLNSLLGRIADANAQKGRFYAAASHELRTPLHVLAGETELALSRPRTAAEYRETLVDVQAQTERLVSLVQSLLLLDRLERFPVETVPREPVDVAALCRRLEAQTARLREERGGLRWTMDAPESATLCAPPEHLEILLRNLFENAVRYARPGGAAHASLTNGAAGLRFEIFNECPPLDAADLGRLFEPFYRPDAARNGRAGGNGLGLSLSRAVAGANGWPLTLSQEETGVRAVVRFESA